MGSEREEGKGRWGMSERGERKGRWGVRERGGGGE